MRRSDATYPTFANPRISEYHSLTRVSARPTLDGQQPIVSTRVSGGSPPSGRSHRHGTRRCSLQTSLTSSPRPAIRAGACAQADVSKSLGSPSQFLARLKVSDRELVVCSCGACGGMDLECMSQQESSLRLKLNICPLVESEPPPPSVREGRRLKDHREMSHEASSIAERPGEASLPVNPCASGESSAAWREPTPRSRDRGRQRLAAALTCDADRTLQLGVDCWRENVLANSPIVGARSCP
jgi:hypothetical protein